MSRATILGVRIDALTREEASEKARAFLSDGEQHAVFTPNPEMLVDAQTDEYFRGVLNSGSLNLCDGFGIQLASRWTLQRIAGVDFLLDISAIAEKMGKRVYLLGGREGAARGAADEIRRLFPSVRIVGYTTGPADVSAATPQEHNDVIAAVKNTTPDVLFVAFGHGTQEKWIFEHLKDLPSVKIAMGVGGAFDMLSGRTRRAPQWMRSIGLEWLWRLLLEPRRIGRIWKATGRFLFLFAIKNRATFS